MSCVFKKLLADAFVSIRDGFGFKKLKTEAEPTPPPPELEKNQIDMKSLGLPKGTYIITVTARAAGLERSEESNAVTYTC